MFIYINRKVRFKLFFFIDFIIGFIVGKIGEGYVIVGEVEFVGMYEEVWKRFYKDGWFCVLMFKEEVG